MNAAWTDQAPWRQLREAPYEHDLFALLRWIDARAGAAQPLGRTAHPAEEPVRLAQQASLAFAPASVAGLREPEGRAPQLSMYGFGLFGPNGPLPLHLTEYARERERMAADPTLVAFADLFHHRLITLFYRAWADSQVTTTLDRPGEARFDAHLASLLGMGCRHKSGRVRSACMRATARPAIWAGKAAIRKACGPSCAPISRSRSRSSSM